MRAGGEGLGLAQGAQQVAAGQGGAVGFGEFRRGNTFGATGFGSYWVFWLALVGFLGVEEPKFPSPAAASHALAVFLLCWLIWTVLLWVATFRVSLVLNLLFLDLIAAQRRTRRRAGLAGRWRRPGP